ncbi:hypothetical protein [Moritella sp. Urea-trap-13]|uniref:hypothetical protein n=1 Tax=Moritella sp. Urea-trap-13 TaxID=2058327 RepID=UPI000C347FDD|nr:hypothetical protein [Moritella sp. Urea-trap-13]PKH06041.1 hypothetical protein CXF93_08870 [Moritella sp. Urea-trap-13]
MQIKLLVSLLAVALALPVFADKPEWAGNGKPTSEQKEAHKSAMQAKSDEQDSTKITKEKKDRTDKEKGSEKQKDKKLNQEQKELDKGSQKGKDSSETRNKWWKFWGE